MTGELSPQVVLTDKQARFVKYAASGMLMKDAWRQATGSKCIDKSARVAAAKMKRIPGVALALAEVLRSKRLMDLDSVGQVISDTREDQEAARADKAHASVANFARMRGNWQSMERQNLLFAREVGYGSCLISR